MKFLEIISDLKLSYEDSYIVRENGTVLLGPSKIPNSRHMLFAPLKQEYIDLHLVSQYSNEFPKDYISFLREYNGANLFSVKIITSEFCFSHSLFVLFGLPITPSFDRPINMEEPFDIRIEDLARHDKIPQEWLKCGTYIRDFNFEVQTDIFVDTQTNQVFACEKNRDNIVDKWDNLDECLCNIYNSFVNSELEYKL